MARAKVCKLCKKEIDPNEEPVKFKERYVHSACFEVYMKAVAEKKQADLEEKAEKQKTKTTKRKPKIELKDGLSEEDYKDKKKVIEYLKMLLDSKEIPSSVYAIVNNDIERYGHTYAGIYSTLKYLHEIKEKELTGNIVGIVPYYYDEAEKYYKEVEDIEQINKGKDIRNMYKEKVVRIKPRKRVVKQLSFDDIGVKDENK